MRRFPFLLLALVGLLAGCSEAAPDDARAAWLQEQLIRDNRIWQSRDPSLLASKYAAMADDPYDWMRGTAALHLADVGRGLQDRSSTRFLTEAEALSVLLLGDPHPENLGTTLVGEGPGPVDGEDVPPGTLSVEWVDLDGAAFGPWLLDVRRGALGVGMLARAAAPDAPEVWADAAVEAFARGYGDELIRLGAGERGWSSTDRDLAVGDLLDDLWDEAEDEGRERKRLGAKVEDGRLLVDEALDADGAGHLPLMGDELGTIERLGAAWAAHPSTPEGFRVLDVVRRYGSGVASLPAERYLALYDLGGDGPEDDQLAQLREVVDPAWFDREGLATVLTASVGGLFADNAERLELAPRLLGAEPEADARYAGLRDGGRVFKVVSWTSWFQDVDHVRVAERVDEGKAELADLLALVDTVGRSLADAHARAPLAGGGTAQDALVADLGGDVDGLVQELLGSTDRERCLSDHALFLELLDTHGPLLGADTLDATELQ